MAAITSLAVQDLTLQFPPVEKQDPGNLVLDRWKAEIQWNDNGHVVITGPNGIGKSVFGKVLAGYIQPQSGSIIINGDAKAPLNRKSARSLGIEYIPQFVPRSNRTSAAEIFWSNSLRAIKTYSKKALRAGVKDAVERLGLDWLSSELIFNRFSELTGLQRILFLILDAVLAGNKLLILDEPTASLSYDEAERLHSALDLICERAPTAPRFILFTHPAQFGPRSYSSYEFQQTGLVRLENLQLAGPVQATLPPALSFTSPKTRIKPRGSYRIELRTRSQDRPVVLEPGEISVIVGPPSREFADLPAALYQTIVTATLARAICDEIRYVPENGNASGIVGELPLTDNLAIDLWSRPEWTWKSKFVRRLQLLERHVLPTIRDYEIRPGDHRRRAGLLSGGNRQKTLLGRMLYGEPVVVVLVDAFKGLDQQNVQRVGELIQTKAANGATFILFAFEFGAERLLANRLIEFRDGELREIEQRETEPCS